MKLIITLQVVEEALRHGDDPTNPAIVMQYFRDRKFSVSGYDISIDQNGFRYQKYCLKDTDAASKKLTVCSDILFS